MSRAPAAGTASSRIARPVDGFFSLCFLPASSALSVVVVGRSESVSVFLLVASSSRSVIWTSSGRAPRLKLLLFRRR